MKYIKCNIHWDKPKKSLNNRIFLFCINQKCMSGKIFDVVELKESGLYEISISFIEPNYFKDELIIGKRITINEASKVLSEGEITYINNY